jgi:rubrerythrin
MSLRSRLRKLFDPVESRREEFEHLSEQAVAKPPELPEPAAPQESAPFRCRVCGFASDDDSYCPVCLAQTMKPVPQPRASPWKP